MARTNGAKTQSSKSQAAAIAEEVSAIAETSSATDDLEASSLDAAPEPPTHPTTPASADAEVSDAEVFEAKVSDAEVSDAEVSDAEVSIPDPQTIDDCLNALKTLLSTVEKLQKVRLEVGDIKPLVVRMLDGEVISGDELEQLKTGVSGLFRLVKAYSDHQTALTHAQPARALLDQVLH